MSGVMIKMAVYGLVRVLVEWLGELPAWYGVVVLAVGGASAVIGVVYAIFQHELKRLLAFHSIENVGIIVLGLGACLLLHARGADAVGGSRARSRAPAHAQPRRLQGSPVPRRRRLREGRGLARDRPPGRPPAADAMDGRRVSRRRHGDRRAPAAERVRLGVAHPPVAARRPGERGRGRGVRGCARARSARSDRRPGRALLREGRRARAARPATACPDRGGRRGGVPDARREVASSRSRASCSGSSPGASPGRSPGSRRGRRTTRRARPSTCRGATRCRLPGSRSSSSSERRCSSPRGAGGAQRPRRAGRADSTSGPSSRWTSAGFTKPLRLVLEAALRPTRDVSQSVRGGVLQEVRYEGHVPHLFDTHSTARSHGLGSGQRPMRGASRAGA